MSKTIDRARDVLAEQATGKMPACRNWGATTETVALRGTLVALRAVPRSQGSRHPGRDPWLPLVLALSVVVCIAATASYLRQGDLLLYHDAYSHLLIARAVFDSATPGVAQLGTVWLPLPHLLMLPFIWNDTLWRSGLAGTLPSMGAYIATNAFLFSTLRRLVGGSPVLALVGTLVFLLNPNVLYLQSTPLSETVCIAATTAACFTFLLWAQDGTLRHLVLLSLAVLVATLVRYDGWALFATVLVGIPCTLALRRRPLRQIGTALLLYGALGGLGIALWLTWNRLICGDALYFQHGPYSSAATNAVLFQTHGAGADTVVIGNLAQAARFYGWAVLDTTGMWLCALAVAGGLLWLCTRRLSPTSVAVLICLTPFPFYVAALSGGQVPLDTPQVSSALFNIRYGVECIVPASVLLTVGLATLDGWRRARARARARARRHTGSPLHVRFQLAAQITAAALLALVGLVALAQVALLWTVPPATLQDGQSGFSCAAPHPVLTYLATHYIAGERVLEDASADDASVTETGVIDFRDVIYQGSNGIWQKALAHPARYVDWVVTNPGNPADFTRALARGDAARLSDFVLVVVEQSGVRLYQRIGTPLAFRPHALDAFNEAHRLCPSAAL